MTKGVAILPADGSVIYVPDYFGKSDADRYREGLLRELCWKSDTVRIFGKLIETRRQMAWYGDEPFDYRYSGQSHFASRWTPLLEEIRDEIAARSGLYFNSCLANKYENGGEAMGWHSDDEKTMDSAFPIVSVSLGATRRFLFRHRVRKEKKEIHLEHGSLLTMHPPTQQFWQHALPKMAAVAEGRINLTFRRFVPFR